MIGFPVANPIGYPTQTQSGVVILPTRPDPTRVSTSMATAVFQVTAPALGFVAGSVGRQVQTLTRETIHNPLWTTPRRSR